MPPFLRQGALLGRANREIGSVTRGNGKVLRIRWYSCNAIYMISSLFTVMQLRSRRLYLSPQQRVLPAKRLRGRPPRFVIQDV